MAKMKIILTDDAGQEINTRTYDLGSNLHRLSAMESQIEELRPQILGDLTQDLLISAQSRDIKKRESAGIKPLK
jgi:hypothetical protein